MAAKAIVGSAMETSHIPRRVGPAVLVLAPLLALIGMAGSAGGYSIQFCAQIPIVGGIPPWGFHTGAPITGASGSYARGHGDINLADNTVSGILCQVDRVPNQPDRLIIMTVEHHLVYHSHYAVMWGFPGNIMKIIVRVKSSTDPRCKVGTHGRVTLFASYNGVRSDSVQFTSRPPATTTTTSTTGRRSTTRSRRFRRSPALFGGSRRPSHGRRSTPQLFSFLFRGLLPMDGRRADRRAARADSHDCRELPVLLQQRVAGSVECERKRLGGALLPALRCRSRSPLASSSPPLSSCPCARWPR